MFGFAAGMGPCTIMEAELRAILIGLLLTKERGFNRIHVETDSLAAVRLINSDCSPLHPSFNIV